jgi:hypothetical protein
MAGADYGVLVFNERKLLKTSGADFVHRGLTFITGKGFLAAIQCGNKKTGTDFINKSGFGKYCDSEDCVAGYYKDKNIRAIEVCVDSSRYTQITISGDTYFVVGGYIYNDDILRQYFVDGNSGFDKEKFQSKSIKKIKEIIDNSVVLAGRIIEQRLIYQRKIF